MYVEMLSVLGAIVTRVNLLVGGGRQARNRRELEVKARTVGAHTNSPRALKPASWQKFTRVSISSARRRNFPGESNENA